MEEQVFPAANLDEPETFVRQLLDDAFRHGSLLAAGFEMPLGRRLPIPPHPLLKRMYRIGLPSGKLPTNRRIGASEWLDQRIRSAGLRISCVFRRGTACRERTITSLANQGASVSKPISQGRSEHPLLAGLRRALSDPSLRCLLHLFPCDGFPGRIAIEMFAHFGDKLTIRQLVGRSQLDR